MPNKITVYPLCHEYELDNGEVESKGLGTFSSREKAQEAIERYRLLPGFRDRPDGFVIYESILDQDAAWTEGYITWDEAHKPLN
jgi:hypothetical protein